MTQSWADFEEGEKEGQKTEGDRSSLSEYT